MKCRAMMMAAAMGLVASGALAQNDGATGGGEARPGQKVPVYTVAPTGPIRGSLFRQGAETPPQVDAEGMPMGGAPVSFIAVEPAKPRKYQKNDIVTVVVREDASSTTTGDATSKKEQDFDTALQQFIQLALSQSGVPTVGTVGNPSNLPEVKFKYQNNRQNDASQARTDSASLRISGTIVDVKPNGTLVIEAIKNISMDQEVQHYTLTGVCRAEDIAADNTILSTQMANLTLERKTKGEVKDGTRRGWLNSIIDKFSPF
ncbi:MAG TPA: flagellar basal body L-ring protein FlgH [Phycisphaerae bacterium]|nr:flagellar basal body L-ring protein FlgH [Phycisphaerae bacterium]